MNSLNKTISSKVLLISLVVLTISLLIGVSGYFFKSPYSALYIGVIFCLFPILFLWIKKPIAALYVILFITLIPYGMIPPVVNDYLYRILSIVIPIIWLFDVIRRREKITFNITALLMFTFLIWGIITLFWSSNISVGIFFLQTYFVRVVVFLLLVLNLVRTEEILDGFMNILALAAWLLVIATLLTIITTGYSPGMRLKVFGENENSLGILALITIVGVAWKASQTTNPNVKYWKLMAYLYIFAAIVITAVSGSRGSFISLLVTFTAFWFWKPTRVLGKVSFLYLIIIGLILPFMYKTVIDRFTIIDQTNTLLGGREALWSAAWLYIKNNPWIGVGIGNSNYVMLTYLQLLRSTLGLDYASVHNPILTIWMETGIPGLVLYLGGLTSAVALFTRQYYKSKRINNDRLNPYFGIVAAVFLGYMFSWLKGGGVESSNTYFLMLALLLIPSGFFPNQSVDQSNRK